MSEVRTITIEDEQEFSLQMLSQQESELISQFVQQISFLKSKHGDKVDKVELVLYPDDDGYVGIFTNEENNGLNGARASLLRRELSRWVDDKLDQLRGWTNTLKVTKFVCVHQNGEFGVLCETINIQPEETV